ncbi:DUF2249 domain-containing protein [Rhodoferax sp.]|uniref:DUF2249 domain-containing protein n=1 Tax=Rhodoferax sp. TaxID=50421 RepID=UPI0027483920|nr:DUF2249 domain-containing protein [Rhodoferax sp.]
MAQPPASQVIDARGLEPPEPLVLALDALDSLGAHDTLLLRLDREPLPLYQALQSSGHTWQTRRGADGAYEVLIWLPGG